jgi:hypothetical protein
LGYTMDTQPIDSRLVRSSSENYCPDFCAKVLTVSTFGYCSVRGCLPTNFGAAPIPFTVGINSWEQTVGINSWEQTVGINSWEQTVVVNSWEQTVVVNSWEQTVVRCRQQLSVRPLRQRVGGKMRLGYLPRFPRGEILQIPNVCGGILSLFRFF